jgi:hypothetical protein
MIDIHKKYMHAIHSGDTEALASIEKDFEMMGFRREDYRVLYVEAIEDFESPREQLTGDTHTGAR